MNRLKYLIPLMGMLLCVNVYAANSQQNVDKPILVKQSTPTFTVTLKSNPSTGYSWFVSKCDHAYIKAVGHKYIAAKKMMPGASGTEVFTFKVARDSFVVPHILSMEFTYARPWDLSSAQTKTIRVVTNDA